MCQPAARLAAGDRQPHWALDDGRPASAADGRGHGEPPRAATPEPQPVDRGPRRRRRRHVDGQQPSRPRHRRRNGSLRPDESGDRPGQPAVEPVDGGVAAGRSDVSDRRRRHGEQRERDQRRRHRSDHDPPQSSSVSIRSTAAKAASARRSTLAATARRSPTYPRSARVAASSSLTRRSSVSIRSSSSVTGALVPAPRFNLGRLRHERARPTATRVTEWENTSVVRPHGLV